MWNLLTFPDMVLIFMVLFFHSISSFCKHHQFHLSYSGCRVQEKSKCAVLAVSMLSVHGFIRWRRCWIVLVEYWQMTLAKRICCMHNIISGFSLITHTHPHSTHTNQPATSYAQIKWHYFISSRVFCWTEQETDIL